MVGGVAFAKERGDGVFDFGLEGEAGAVEMLIVEKLVLAGDGVLPSNAAHVAFAASNQLGPRGLSATPSKSNAFCPLAALPWKRPNIGSPVTREGYARLCVQ